MRRGGYEGGESDNRGRSVQESMVVVTMRGRWTIKRKRKEKKAGGGRKGGGGGETAEGEGEMGQG